MKNRPCPTCRSNGGDKTGDHLFLLKSGEAWHCTRCGHTEQVESNKIEEESPITNKLTIESIGELSTVPYRDVDVDILEAAGVKMALSPSNRQPTDVFYPMVATSGELVAYKQRVLPKKGFYTTGSVKDIPLQFFGQSEIGTGGKFLIVVEGEDDVLSARDMLKQLGKSYNVVGLHSAAWAETTCRNNISFLESFDTVVFATDQDQAGQNAAAVMSGILSPGKSKIASWKGHKDACDMHKAGKFKEFLDALWKAKVYTPRGIVAAGDFKDKWLSTPPRESLPLPDCFSELQEMIGGIGIGEVTLVTGGTGSGKSQMFDQASAFWLKNNYRVGKLAMEHNVQRSVDNTLSVMMERNLKKYRDEYSKEELGAIYDEAFANNAYNIIDHSYDDATDESLIDKVRQLAITSKCDVIIVDHLSAILYEDSADSGTSREDRVVRDLVKIANQCGVAIVLVAHPRKTSTGTKSVESGAFLSLDDLKGSSGIKQQPDVIISAVRDITAEDPKERTLTQYHVLKNRYHSTTGPAGKTTFNIDTANYEAYVEPQGEF